jgi:hypothetical protein
LLVIYTKIITMHGHLNIKYGDETSRSIKLWKISGITEQLVVVFRGSSYVGDPASIPVQSVCDL